VRLVIDTNVLVSALIFKDSRHLPLRAAWSAQRVTPLLSMATYRELKKVLGYRMFAITDDKIAEAISTLGPYIEWIEIDEERSATLPKCSDRDGRADAIITYDKALLKLRRRALPFQIRRPDEIAIPA
jgi:uncharacterized protein